MENQHRMISGYRELSQGEIDLMNEIKAEGERLQSLINRINAFNNERPAQDGDAPYSNATIPSRWIAIGQTDLQTGLMALTRAVAAPHCF